MASERDRTPSPRVARTLLLQGPRRRSRLETVANADLSLAEAQGPRAAAVVLSGTGADGASGAKRVKERGGPVLVQDPAEAEYDSMPRQAIATGLADVVLPILVKENRPVSVTRRGGILGL